MKPLPLDANGEFLMVIIPEQLREIEKQVNADVHPWHSVRTLLQWFDAHRRSVKNVARIRAALEHLSLKTSPDFEGEYIDSPVMFLNKDASQAPSANGDQASSPTTTTTTTTPAPSET